MSNEISATANNKHISHDKSSGETLVSTHF